MHNDENHDRSYRAATGHHGPLCDDFMRLWHHL